MKYHWGGGNRTYYINTLHESFPKYQITGISKQDGYLYGNTYDVNFKQNFIFKMNNFGNVVFYMHRYDMMPYNFQPILLDNKLFYKYYVMNNSTSKAMIAEINILDENFNNSSKVHTNYFYKIDDHEHIVLSKNHIIYATYHPDYIDDKLVNAIRILEYKNGSTIELFNSLDYPEFVEMSSEKNKIKPTNIPIDYLHLNSMQLVGENSILMSMPSANSIIKYNYKDKKIEWILGGKLDQFGLSKEQQFYFQHFARLNGNELTLFDNHIKNRWDVKGDEYARALEFKIDEKNKKILAFKEYKNELHKNLKFCGSFQKNVAGENVFYNIAWGCYFTEDAKSSSYYTEIEAKTNKINFELIFDDNLNGTYRILKFPY